MPPKAAEQDKQGVLRMKQTSILGYFSRKTTVVLKDVAGERQKENSNGNAPIQTTVKSKAVKRKLDDNFEDNNNVWNRKIIDDDNNNKKTDGVTIDENVDDDHEITDATDRCEIDFYYFDEVLCDDRIQYPDSIPEVDCFKDDLSLLRFMIRKVFTNYAYLFSSDDRLILEQFLGLKTETQSCYMKYFKRKRNWQRIEGHEGVSSLRDLLDLKFFQPSSDHSFSSIDEIFDMLKVSEIQDACKKLNIASAGNRKTLIAGIQKSISTQRTLSISPTKSSQSEITFNFFQKFIRNKFFRINPEKEFFFLKIILLFYNPYSCLLNYAENSNYFWAFYIQNDNFLYSPIMPKTVIYDSPEDYDNFVTMFVKAQQFRAKLELSKALLIANCNIDDIKTQIWDLFIHYCVQRNIDSRKDLPQYLRRFTSSAILFTSLSDIFLNSKASTFFTTKILEPKESIFLLKELLEDSINSTNHRSALILRLLKLVSNDYELEREYLWQLLEMALVDSSSICGLYDALTIKNFQKAFPGFCQDIGKLFTKNFPEKTIYAKYRSVELAGGNRNSFYFEENGQEHYVSVEDVARMHYCKENNFSKSVHCEGSIYMILFDIIFHDEIESKDVPDHYRYYRQEMPLDIKFSSSFLSTRKDAIRCKIDLITNMERKNFLEFFTEALLETGHDDGKYNMFDIIDIAGCFGPKRIVKLCETILNNYCDYRKGFPDLLLWEPGTDRIEMIEVKGCRDTLSPHQILWLNRLNSIGFNAYCCHVYPST